MDDKTMIMRRIPTDKEEEIGLELNDISKRISVLCTELLATGYNATDERFAKLFLLLKEFTSLESDFFGFDSWEDLIKWKEIHGTIFINPKGES